MSVTVLNICHICHQSCEVKRFSYKKIFTSQLNIRPVKIYIPFYSNEENLSRSKYNVGSVSSVSDKKNLLKISIFHPI